MQQYFLEEKLFVGGKVKLNDDILFHLKKVLRKKSDYQMRLVDSEGKVYLAKLSNADAIIIDELKDDRELKSELVLAMALIKHDRFEWAIQKATELGATKIIPMITERVVIKTDSEAKRLERYRKIIKEAAEQSLRNKIPVITDFMTLDEVIDLDIKRKIVAYEKEDRTDLEMDAADTLILIGPEGGFSEEEFAKLISNGFISISLGKRILRAETAACAALAILGRSME